MFDDHQIITANGAAFESYQPGDHSLPGLHDAARASIPGAMAHLLAA